MLSSIKRVLTILIIFTVAAAIGFYYYTKGRTYYNSESELGNTIGNIYNGGLFCEQDNIIYFHNDLDHGKLYKMTSSIKNVQKVSDEKAVYINVDNNYIYYARANDITGYNPEFFSILNNNGVFRINLKGNGLKAFTGDPGAFLLLKGNYLFFERYSAKDGFHLARFKIDGSMERNLINAPAIPIASIKQAIYYTNNSKDTSIDAMNLSSYTRKTYYSGSFAYPIFTKNYIYYIDRDNKNNIYRMKHDGSNKTLLVKKSCSTYNITNSGSYLYYQVNGTKNDYIGRINLKTMKSETVKKGNYKQINITKYYVFFKDIDNKNTYVTLADQKLNVSNFQPKVKKVKKKK